MFLLFLCGTVMLMSPPDGQRDDSNVAHSRSRDDPKEQQEAARSRAPTAPRYSSPAAAAINEAPFLVPPAGLRGRDEATNQTEWLFLEDGT